MAKVCANGDGRPVWSKKLCLSCWGREYGKPIKSKGTRIKPQRESEKEIKVALSFLKREIELEAIQNDEYYCAGCGSAKPGLDKSHILAVGDRKDLELVKANIILLCRRCHLIWDGGNFYDKIKLLCFSSSLEFIRQHDTVRYNKLKSALDEYNGRYFK